MCYIANGRSGACDRYANEDGQLVRVDPMTILERRKEVGGDAVAFLGDAKELNSDVIAASNRFVTAVGAGTTYPDYKPAPFIVASEVNGVDMITVVTQGIFSYCGAKVKIDTDRHLGPERSFVHANGEPIGHVTTGEYGSQMLSLGGVHHLTGGTKKEGSVTCAALLALCNGEVVDLTIDDGSAKTASWNMRPRSFIQEWERHCAKQSKMAQHLFRLQKRWARWGNRLMLLWDTKTRPMSGLILMRWKCASVTRRAQMKLWCQSIVVTDSGRPLPRVGGLESKTPRERAGCCNDRRAERIV
jgi:hypothetical protein